MHKPESKLSERKNLKANLGGSGFHTKKSLGQNFLVNEAIARDIVDGAGVGPEDLVLEIGPGVGSLTRYLLARARKVVAVELDSKAIPLLRKNTADFLNLEIIEGDILKVDLKGLLEGEREVKVVANLPYYITSPILMYLLEGGLPLEGITVMVQKEVGERLMASPGGKDYGILTLACAYYAEVEKIVDVGKENFHPVPKVDSMVVRLIPRSREDRLPEKTERSYFALIKAGFGMRRKNLLNALASLFAGDKVQVRRFLEEAGIDGGRRAETLSKEEFFKLAKLRS